jgi:hypothetical protein
MQRRPWLKIPLKVMGPLAQPHPSIAKIDPAALTGGMVLTNKLMQLKTGDVLNYFEVYIILYIYYIYIYNIYIYICIYMYVGKCVMWGCVGDE